MGAETVSDVVVVTGNSGPMEAGNCDCGFCEDGDWICRTGQHRHGDPRFYALLEEIAALHSKKNHDYAKDGEPLSNFHRSASFGIEPWKGILVRMSDKWSRIEELSKGKEPQNESLRDSLIDNAVYSLLCILLLEDAKG